MIKPLRADYDAFLFARIGESANGMSVSILSTLARQNLDPWQEAAELSKMPTKAAIDRLATHIANGAEPPCDVNAEALAQRCIELLPHRRLIEPPGSLSTIRTDPQPLFSTDHLIMPHPKEIMLILVVVLAGTVAFHYATRDDATAPSQTVTRTITAKPPNR
jgi:hypothetical protein